jgi:hypothetical protein
MTAVALPLFVVCEDGEEYTQRFERFLGRQFRFRRVADGASAETAVKTEPAAGLLLDLDFRRLSPNRLVGESGPPSQPPTAEERSRWAATQGVLILSHLRRRDVVLPALLFADFDDATQVEFLERSYAPLAVVGSREGLAQLAARLQRMVAGE